MVEQQRGLVEDDQEALGSPLHEEDVLGVAGDVLIGAVLDSVDTCPVFEQLENGQSG